MPVSWAAFDFPLLSNLSALIVKYKKPALLLTLLLAFGFFEQAQAQTSRLYFGGYMGLLTFNDQDFTESSAPASGALELKNGYSLTGALGLRLSRELRVEAELSYGKTDFDRIQYVPTGASGELGGELITWGTMLNAYYDFDVPWKIQPFVGAGAGFTWHTGEISDGAGIAVDVSEKDFAFAWQVGGGLKYRVAPDLAFSGSYRYSDSMDLQVGSYEIDYGAHEFRIGLEYDLSFE